MTVPGVTVTSRATPPPRSAPTDTGVWFVVGLTDRGPSAPGLVTSLSEFATKYGGRVSYSILYDALETFFKEGGGKVMISRVGGPAALQASAMLNDSGAAATLKVLANGFGAWGNTLNVAVVAGTGSNFKLVITDDVLGALETSPEFPDKASAISWANKSSKYILLQDQPSLNNPAVVAAVSLAGGTDDRVNLTDASWKTALDKFSVTMGPGQVSMPGRTTQQAHTDLLAHAAVTNRLAVLDAPDSSTPGTLTAAATAQRATANARYGGLFAPWDVIPGIIAGTTRTVPPSARQCGQMARNDGLGISQNRPAAGRDGEARYVIGLSQPEWSDTDRGTLNDAGVNVSKNVYGAIRTYGWRTLVDPAGNDQQWLNLGNARLNMAIAAKGNAIAEEFVFDQIDGQRRTIGDFGGRLTGMLMPFWEKGSLYGTTPEDAFAVDVGEQINTLATIAAGELHAVIQARMSPDAERVILEIVKVNITEAVS